jgi:arsenite/tail-anchored protein-transporting ATPase
MLLLMPRRYCTIVLLLVLATTASNLVVVWSFQSTNTWAKNVMFRYPSYYTKDSKNNRNGQSSSSWFNPQSPMTTNYSSHRRRLNHSSHLFSLRHLVEQVNNPLQQQQQQQQQLVQKTPQTILVGGKGGVGKTTVSSALAVKLASSCNMGDNDNRHVLVVSTDPAHSLGDALDTEELRKARGRPVLMTDPITNGRLYACEVDASAALEEFRQNLEAFDVTKLASALGVSPDLLNGFGLSEFSGLLKNPPPGLDELVALSNVLNDNDDNTDMAKLLFDVIIVDTAPTGHTLRLLALPQFLDGLLGKLIQLRMKLSRIASTLQALFSSSSSSNNKAEAEQRAQAMDNAVDRLEQFRIKMARLRSRLQDPSATSFVVVTIPTKLGVSESKRLLSELSSQRVSVTDVVVNQCISDIVSDEVAVEGYYQRRKAGQDLWINKLQETIDQVSASSEYQENGSTDDKPIAMTTVPFFDVELVGVPALFYLGSQCFLNNPNFAHLMDDDDSRSDNDCKVLICGGKVSFFLVG